MNHALQEHKGQLQEQLNQLTGQLTALLTQQSELNGRTVTLEKVLASQQQQVDLLKAPEVMPLHSKSIPANDNIHIGHIRFIH